MLVNTFSLRTVLNHPDQDISFINARTIEIKALIHSTNRNLLEIGQKLLEVKEGLGHGHFGTWLKAEFDWSEDTAQRCMRIAKNLPHIPHGAEFEANALYLLASPSTPQGARFEALELAESGTSITHTVAKSIVERHKQDDEDVVRLEAIATVGWQWPRHPFLSYSLFAVKAGESDGARSYHALVSFNLWHFDCDRFLLWGTWRSIKTLF